MHICERVDSSVILSLACLRLKKLSKISCPRPKAFIFMTFFHVTSSNVNSVVLKQSRRRANSHFLKRKLIFVVVVIEME